MDDDDKDPQGDDEWVNIVDPCAKKLIERYLERREEDLSSLRSSVAERDFESIRVQGHNLAGSGSAYGLDRISEIGRALEDAALEEDQATIVEQIIALDNYIHRLRIL